MSVPTQSTNVVTEKDGKSNSVWKAPFVIVSLAYILNRGSWVIFGPAKGDIAKDIGATLPEVLGSRMTAALVCAVIIIPVAILITRLGSGRLAWIGVMLLSIGNITIGFSPDIVIFYTGTIIMSFGSAMLVPLFGQIGRDSLSVRTFVVAATLVMVFGRGAQSVSLILAGLVYEMLGWRILYICWGAAMIPLIILAWRFIKPTKPIEEVSSVKKLLSMLGGLLKQPLVWMCGISFGLTMASVTNFGFVWDLNLQDALGWGVFDANLLAFMFVAGVIGGGYFVTLLSKWIGEYHAILISMGVGVIVFFISIYVTSSFRDIWISSPLLFFVGLSLGAGTMIQPHISRFYEQHMSAMFFGITMAMYFVFTGFIIAVPEWSLPKVSDWSITDMRHALFPYVIMIAIGILIFAFTKYFTKSNSTKEEVV